MLTLFSTFSSLSISTTHTSDNNVPHLYNTSTLSVYSTTDMKALPLLLPMKNIPFLCGSQLPHRNCSGHSVSSTVTVQVQSFHQQNRHSRLFLQLYLCLVVVAVAQIMMLQYSVIARSFGIQLATVCLSTDRKFNIYHWLTHQSSPLDDKKND